MKIFNKKVVLAIGVALISLLGIFVTAIMARPVLIALIPTLTSTPTLTPTATPVPPTIPPPALPYHWPVAPLTNDQINAVNQCYLMTPYYNRYLNLLNLRELPAALVPQSACDWASLAFAYAQRLSEAQPLPQAAKDAFAQAVAGNPGFALANPLFYKYFDSVSLVEPPPFAAHEITEVRIRYQWAGLGDPVYYTAEIHDANSTPVVIARPDTVGASTKTTVDKKMVQALMPALTDLVPVRSWFSISPCYDNYPSWEVTLTFTDDTALTVESSSNFLDFGGPWFTSLQGQEYIQLSSAFPEALGRLVSALHLPPGEWGAMTCGGDQDVFGQAFPARLMADTGPTPIPVTPIPTPAVTATSLFKLTHVAPGRTLTGIFASKESLPDRVDYELYRFYDDGVVVSANMGFTPENTSDWLSDVSSFVRRDSRSACPGKYYRVRDQIEFSVTCVEPTFWWDETPTPVIIDYSGTYDGEKLILDSYSHYNGFSAVGEVFLPIDDPALKP